MSIDAVHESQPLEEEIGWRRVEGRPGKTGHILPTHFNSRPRLSRF